MGREDRSTWKSNYFMRLLVSGGSVWFVIRDGQYDTTIVDAIDTDPDWSCVASEIIVIRN